MHLEVDEEGAQGVTEIETQRKIGWDSLSIFYVCVSVMQLFSLSFCSELNITIIHNVSYKKWACKL